MTEFFSGDYSNAQRHAQQFIAAHPDSPYRPDLEYRLGVMDYLQERYRAAAVQLVQFVRAYTNHPMLAEARVLRGDALAAMGELLIAIKAYRETEPESGPYYHYAVSQMGKCYKALEDYTNMVALYHTYVNSVPDSPNVVEGLYWLGWAHRQAGAYAAARDAYWDALTRFGNRRDWWGFDAIARDMHTLYAGSNGLAELEIRITDEAALARARGKLTLASRLDITRHSLLLAQHRATDAADLAACFVRSYPTNILGADGLMFVVKTAGMAGSPTQAAPYLAQIITVFSNSPFAAEAQLLCAQHARQRGDLAQAGRLLAVAADAAQDAAIALQIAMEKARWLMASDRAAEAIAAYDEILANRAARGPLWPEALLGLGLAHEELRDYRKAVPYYQRIYVMYAGYSNLVAQAYYHSGRCFERLEDSSAAINTYRELLADVRLAQLPETRQAAERLKALTGVP